MKRRKFSSELKAQTVKRILLGTETVIEAARRLECNPQNIQRWKDQALEALPTVFTGESKEQLADKKKIEQLERAIGKIASQNSFLEHVLSNLD